MLRCVVRDDSGFCSELQILGGRNEDNCPRQLHFRWLHSHEVHVRGTNEIPTDPSDPSGQDIRESVATNFVFKRI